MISVIAVAEDYADRRQHSRRSAYLAAELAARGGLDAVGCTILDESEGGLQLQVALSDAPRLPEEALIKFSDTASQLVRRCWANGTRAGYRYIEVDHAARSLFPGVLAAQTARAKFLAFANFIDISRDCLDLPGEAALLYPAQQIHALLREQHGSWTWRPILT